MSDLQDCLLKLRYLHLATHADSDTLFHRRYRKESAYGVASINPLSINIEEFFGLRKQQEQRNTFVYTSSKRMKTGE
jgi:hypothetical protein